MWMWRCSYLLRRVRTGARRACAWRGGAGAGRRGAACAGRRPARARRAARPRRAPRSPPPTPAAAPPAPPGRTYFYQAQLFMGSQASSRNIRPRSFRTLLQH